MSCGISNKFKGKKRKKRTFLDRAFDDATGVVRLWFPCTASVKMLEGLSAKNTSLTPQQWFVLAFLEEPIPLISKTVKFILGFALFSFWDVNSYALQLKKMQNAVAVLGSAPAAGSSCSLHCAPRPPACLGLGKNKSISTGRRSQKLFCSAPVAAWMC